MELQTDNWLECAKDAFEYCLDGGDYETCDLIIKDVRDKGYPGPANIFRKQLLSTCVFDFKAPTISPYQGL